MLKNFGERQLYVKFLYRTYYKTNTKIKGLNFLQANVKRKIEKQVKTKKYKAPKIFLPTEDSTRTLEADRPTVLQLLKNKKQTEKDIQEQIDNTESNEEIQKLKAEKKLVKKSVKISTDKQGNNHVLVRPDIDLTITNPDTPGHNSDSDHFEEQRLSSNSTTQRHTTKRKKQGEQKRCSYGTI